MVLRQTAIPQEHSKLNRQIYPQIKEHSPGASVTGKMWSDRNPRSGKAYSGGMGGRTEVLMNKLAKFNFTKLYSPPPPQIKRHTTWKGHL